MKEKMQIPKRFQKQIREIAGDGNCIWKDLGVSYTALALGALEC